MMKASTQLLEDMNTRLNNISGLAEDDLQSIQEAILTVSECIARLNTMIVSEGFQGTADEVRFFKQIKPQFDGRLIFYLLLLRLMACSSSATLADRYTAYVQELEKLQSFIDQHYAFWQYCQMNQTHQDEYYFLRRTPGADPLLEDYQVHYDWKTNTLMSVTAARIYAYNLLREQASVVASQVNSNHRSIKKANSVALQWTSAKAGLIELIYAFQEYGVFNNSQVEVKKIADYFTSVFQVHFGNVYKTYEDIRLRKKNRTPFLDALKSALERRIDRDNEHAM